MYRGPHVTVEAGPVGRSSPYGCGMGRGPQPVAAGSEAPVRPVTVTATVARVLYRAMIYVGIGLAYQAMAYGEASWSSTVFWGHVLGWWIFVGADVLVFLGYFGATLLGVALVLVPSALIMARYGDWKRARKRRKFAESMGLRATMARS